MGYEPCGFAVGCECLKFRRVIQTVQQTGHRPFDPWAAGFFIIGMEPVWMEKERKPSMGRDARLPPTVTMKHGERFLFQPERGIMRRLSLI